MPPRLSVCIPSYNQARFIGAAVDSVLAQAYGDFELLVIDDCSTDGTREIVAGYASDSRVRYIASPVNRGMVENWNACLDEARGEYVKFLFGDDLFVSPDALGRMVAALDAEPHVSLVTTARVLVDAAGCRTGISEPFRRDRTISGTVVITRCLAAQRNLVGEPSAVMFRKSQAGRGFNVRYRQYVDLEMWFHLLEQGNLHYLHEPLVAFRRHGQQQTKVNVRNLIHIDELLALYHDYFARPYVRIGSAGKQFLILGQQYRIWKLYRQGTISRQEAETRIERGYGFHRFLRHLPWYKAASPLWKVRLFLDRIFR